MKHLRTYKRLDEARLDTSMRNCDFDEFKTVMFEITDQCFSHYFFDKYERGNPYYMCEFYVTDISKVAYEVNIESSFDYLQGFFSTYEDEEVFDDEEDNSKIYDSIDSKLVKLDNAIKEINTIIDVNKKFSKIIKDIEEYIIPRFKSYENFDECSIILDADSYVSLKFYHSFKKINM